MNKKKEEQLAEEQEYLDMTLTLLKQELERTRTNLADGKEKLRASGEDMWENAVHFSNDFTRMAELGSYLNDLRQDTYQVSNTQRQVKRYERMLNTPYFGRFDFRENGEKFSEKIYIGLNNLMDPDNYQIVVYDWRAPISEIYYQYDNGRAEYSAPMGTIAGEVLLKRQYRIKNAQIIFFVDSNATMTDDILQEILSSHASGKMHNIVKTIQKEQDRIIRDTENSVVIVQGTAGSGKTSIALHRIAFLLYAHVKKNLSSNDFLIISPNHIFSRYITTVLPELGEENVTEVTFDDIAFHLLPAGTHLETRAEQLGVVFSNNRHLSSIRQSAVEFKGSQEFKTIIERMIRFYVRRIMEFQDIYYDGITVATREEIKNAVLSYNSDQNAAKKMLLLQRRLQDRISPLRKKRLERIEKITAGKREHQLEVKAFSRLMSIKKSKSVNQILNQLIPPDCRDIYKELFNRPGMLKKMAANISLPSDIDEIISLTRENILRDSFFHEDAAPLLHIKLELEGDRSFPGIRHVVIDEAQDYAPMHFSIYGRIFRGADFTMVGDTQQAMDRNTSPILFDQAAETIGKKTAMYTLDKCYRSTIEIHEFCRKIFGSSIQSTSYGRHGDKPMIKKAAALNEMNSIINGDITELIQAGYTTTAIICRNSEEAEYAFSQLHPAINKIHLISERSSIPSEGIVVLPAYMAKGLEFDAVLIYNATKSNYSDEMERRLLYVACTRALHKLHLYHCGDKSPFLPRKAVDNI